MNNLITRSVSGIIYIAVIITALIMGSEWLSALCILLGILALNELLNLCGGAPLRPYRITERVMELLTIITVVGVATGGDWFTTEYSVLIGISIAALNLRLMLTVFDTDENALRRCAYACFGYLYIGLPLIALAMLGNALKSDYDYSLPLAMFIMIWLNDTGAYCVGSTMGRRRLCERLSPKKSWEGFWGGMIFAMLAGLGYGLICDPDASIFWAIGGGLVSVAATLGDLFESLIKRTVGVKDSGKLIPGHGGILDRIDSLLFAAPVLLLYTLLR